LRKALKNIARDQLKTKAVTTESIIKPWAQFRLSFAKTLQGPEFFRVAISQVSPHAYHFKRILIFGEGQPWSPPLFNNFQKIGFRCGNTTPRLLDLRFHWWVESTPRASVAQSASLALGPQRTQAM
jgi:hypothetical protein